MKRPGQFRTGTAVLAILALAGCEDVATLYKSPGFAASATYAGLPPVSSETLSRQAFWEGFQDPVLNGLIHEALAGSFDLARAKERVTEAKALAGSLAGPGSLSGSAQAGQEGGNSRADGIGAEVTLGYDWLFDPWGERRAQNRAAQGRIQVADAEWDAARLLLVSNLTNAYLELRFQQRSLQLRQQEMAARRKTLDFVLQLVENRAATRLEAIRAEALYAETQSLVPRVEAAIRIAENRIATLMGKAPGQLGNRLVAQGTALPRAKALPAIGAPADLLRQRPDIRIAERLYYVAVAETDARRAQLYPTLSLSGDLTLSAFGGSERTDYFFGPTLRLPALPNGSRKAGLSAQESRARQALTSWKATVLGALEEVENALVDYTASEASLRASEKTVALYQESVELTRELITRDGATVRDLLDAERAVAAANIRLAQDQRDLARAAVALQVSVGAGGS